RQNPAAAMQSPVAPSPQVAPATSPAKVAPDAMTEKSRQKVTITGLNPTTSEMKNQPQPTKPAVVKPEPKSETKLPAGSQAPAAQAPSPTKNPGAKTVGGMNRPRARIIGLVPVAVVAKADATRLKVVSSAPAASLKIVSLAPASSAKAPPLVIISGGKYVQPSFPVKPSPTPGMPSGGKNMQSLPVQASPAERKNPGVAASFQLARPVENLPPPQTAESTSLPTKMPESIAAVFLPSPHAVSPRP